MVDRAFPKVPVAHADEAEHRRLLANRSNAVLQKSLVQAQDTSGTSYGAGPTDVAWNTENFDTGDEFDGTSFTATREGKYRISFTLTHDGSITLASVWLISLVTTLRTYTVRRTTAVAAADTVVGSFLVDMAAGDTAKITIQRASGLGNFVLTSTADENTFCIEESVPFK